METKFISMSEIKEPTIAMRHIFDLDSLSELIESIGKIGLINPITLKEDGDKYQIVAGHRRFKACQSLNWISIPATIIKTEQLQEIKYMADENLQRSDVSPIEEGDYYLQIMERYNLTQTDLSRVIGKAPSYINERVNASKYPESLKEAVKSGAISFSAARELDRIKDEGVKLQYVEYASQQGITPQVAKLWKEDANSKIEQMVSEGELASTSGTPLQAPRIVIKGFCEFCEGEHEIIKMRTISVCAPCLSAFQADKEAN